MGNQIVSYQRVSSFHQASEGISLEAQEARIKAWAVSKGFTVAESFVDAGISGKKMSNRPALPKAIETACKLKCPLVVYSLSRCSRSVADSLFIVSQLQKAGADLVSLSENIDTTTASGKLTFQLFISLAEHERNLISERTKGALGYMKRQGKRTGNIPFGYSLASDGESLSWNQSEQALIQSMKADRESGKSYWTIAKGLNDSGRATKKGGKWSAGSVFRILGNQIERAVAA